MKAKKITTLIIILVILGIFLSVWDGIEIYSSDKDNNGMFEVFMCKGLAIKNITQNPLCIGVSEVARAIE